MEAVEVEQVARGALRVVVKGDALPVGVTTQEACISLLAAFDARQVIPP